MGEMDDFAAGRRLHTLRRVVPIARTDAHSNLALTLHALDDYSDGFEVRGRLLVLDDHHVRFLAAVHQRESQVRLRALLDAQDSDKGMVPMIVHSGSPPEYNRPLWPELLWSVRDDSGNRYEVRDWGGGAHLDEYRIEFTFEPALDPAARVLWIEVVEIAWTNLPPSKEGEVPERVDPGPWMFPVDLTAGRYVVQNHEAE